MHVHLELCDLELIDVDEAEHAAYLNSDPRAGHLGEQDEGGRRQRVDSDL